MSPSRTARPRVSPRISYVVGRLDRALRREIAALVAPHGLTVPQYTALSILRDRAGLSNAQLARRSYVTPQSMNEVIAALERDGLVARSPAANHGRVLEMTLTDAGRDVLARCDAAVNEMENRMLADLDDEERTQLLTALKQCVHQLGAGLPDT
ncbi:MAG TPA: MarR family transcriptional regulator [Solirubrobacteraceae bacterium]|nr:MarR family transcriptional regulator [Solirubrobacteraceae bacterium]